MLPACLPVALCMPVCPSLPALAAALAVAFSPSGCIRQCTPAGAMSTGMEERWLRSPHQQAGKQARHGTPQEDDNGGKEIRHITPYHTPPAAVGPGETRQLRIAVSRHW